MIVSDVSYQSGSMRYAIDPREIAQQEMFGLGRSSESVEMNDVGFFSTKPMGTVSALVAVGIGLTSAFVAPLLVKAPSAKIAFASIGGFVTSIGILNLIDSLLNREV